MKKALLKILVLCIAICSMLFVFTACGESPISFKLNFIVDNEIVKTIDTTGNEKIALPNDPQKDGYTFDGWFWDKDVWEKPFTANSLLDAPLSSDMSVYAKFTKNHEHNYTTTITAPTCTEKGYTTYTCDCGYSYVDNYTNALEHEFTNYVYDNNATYDEDGTKTAVCNHGCGEKHTVTDVGTKLQSGIAFKTLAVDGNNVYGKISNNETTFDFLTEIEKKGNVTYEVSKNLAGDDIIVSKTAEPRVGNNNYYILVYQNGDLLSRYNVTIRRREIYDVTFNTNGGTAVAPQRIEEDSFATEPITERAGYTFTGWNYIFDNPITENTVINASWAANTDTKYKVEYYLQNLADDNYTLDFTDNLTGETDTQATATIKTYVHFTHIVISDSEESSNINCDGTTVLKVFYERDRYEINIYSTTGIGSVKGNSVSSCKYDYIHSAITVTINLGYEWQGWYSIDDEFITKDFTISSFKVDKNINYIAKCFLKDEMSNFNFTSTADTCSITGILINTVTEIMIPSYVTNIGNRAFQFCKNLTNITIPNSVTSIGDHVFYGCSRLTSIIIPGSVTSIGYQVFYGCSCLTTITISNSVTRIGYQAFYNCSSLESITIPNSVKYIGGGAFEGCTSLAVVNWNAASCGCGDSSGAYFSRCVSLKTVIIGDDVTEIEAYTFRGCPATEIIISDSVKRIGYQAFVGCSNLEQVVIGKNVTRIDSRAFYNCNALKTVTFTNTDLSWWIRCSGGYVKPPDTDSAIFYLVAQSEYYGEWIREDVFKL